MTIPTSRHRSTTQTLLRLTLLVSLVLQHGTRAFGSPTHLFSKSNAISNFSGQVEGGGGGHGPGGHKNEGSDPSSPEFWYHLFISVMLVLGGGVCAGLTLGLMGLDDLHLRVLAASSEDVREKKNAQTVLNLLQGRRHWVLVVLLLSNVIVNESLPIFLDNALGGGFAAIVISTAAIVVFGEIIPQALSVRYGLGIGASCAPFVVGLMYLMAPIAYPISWLLDRALGTHERHTYKKAELKSLLQFHSSSSHSSASGHGGSAEPLLRDDEICILNGVLELGSKRIESIMTRLQNVMVLSADTVLDQAAINAIIQSGYSRFPVHLPNRPKAFIGLLLVKRLLGYDPKEALPVSAFPLSILPEAHTSINCFQALDYFQTGRAHLLLISRTPGVEGGALGVVTLEDIIEEMITEEIIDETDRYSDNQSKVCVSRTESVHELGLGLSNNIVERGIHHSTMPLSMSAGAITESSPLLMQGQRYMVNGEPVSRSLVSYTNSI